jgi:hypothetical protein
VPIELNDLRLKRTRKLAVPINDGETLAIEWNPSNMTPETFARMQEWFKNDEKDDPFEGAKYVICPLMTAWEITDGGEPYPITPENVAGLGLDFVIQAGNAIMADYRLAADTKKGSGAA